MAKKKKGKKRIRKLLRKGKNVKQIADITGKKKARIRNVKQQIGGNQPAESNRGGGGSVKQEIRAALRKATEDNTLSRSEIKNLSGQFEDTSAKKLSRIIGKFGNKNQDLSIFKDGDRKGIKGFIRKVQSKSLDNIKSPGDIDDQQLNQKPTETPLGSDNAFAAIINQLNDLSQFSAGIGSNEFLMNDSMFIGGRNARGVRFRKSRNKNRTKGTGQLKRSVRNQGLTMNPVNV